MQAYKAKALTFVSPSPCSIQNLPDFQLQDKAKRFYMYNVKAFYPQRHKGTHFLAFNKRIMGVIF